jgi:hypothetical protein
MSQHLTDRDVIDLWQQTKEVHAFAEALLKAERLRIAEQFEARHQTEGGVYWLAAANHVRSLNGEQLFDDWNWK